jgi:hypothetical protein
MQDAEVTLVAVGYPRQRRAEQAEDTPRQQEVAMSYSCRNRAARLSGEPADAGRAP